MRRAIVSLFSAPELNEIQKKAVTKYADTADFDGRKLTANNFRNKPWFNAQRHLDQLSEWVRYKYSYDEALVRIELANRPFLGLNDPQVQALKLYSREGLTRDDLLARPWFNHQYYFDALYSSTLFNCDTLATALRKIEGLDKYQARAISNGFEREEVFGKSREEIRALERERSARADSFMAASRFPAAAAAGAGSSTAAAAPRTTLFAGSTSTNVSAMDARPGSSCTARTGDPTDETDDLSTASGISAADREVAIITASLSGV